MKPLKLTLAMIACIGLATPSLVAARDADKGPPQQQGGGKGGEKKAKHMHGHKNAHDLIAGKLKQNGKHAIDKLGNREVDADVKNEKVVNMTAGDLMAKRVKTKMKMADLGSSRQAQAGAFQSVQYYDDYYYGYCFDDGYDFICYWYPAYEVDYVDYYWDDYDPYY